MPFSISNLKTFPQEIEGVEQEYSDGAFVTIARMNNPRYRAYLNKLMRELTQKKIRRHAPIDIDSIDPEDDDTKPIICRAMSKYIVKNWRGFVNDLGKEIPYSPEVAEQWLMEYDKFFQDIVLMSNEGEIYSRAYKESIEKN